MSTITATAAISNDISYTLIKLGSNQQSESASLGYSRSLASPTSGSPSGLQINYGVLTSGSIASGNKVSFDLQSFPKQSFGATQSITFTNIKAMVVENQGTLFGEDLTIGATGTNSFTEPWNSSGGVTIKPYAVWQYADPISGAVVDGSNKDFVVQNNTNSGILYTVIAVGVTG